MTAQSTLEAKDAEALFRLFSSLDAYVNSRLQLVDGCRTPAEVRSANRASLHKIRGALWTNLDLLTAFIADNPFALTASELAQVAAWKDAVVGQFYVERSLKAGTILVTAPGPTSVYLVAGTLRRSRKCCIGAAARGKPDWSRRRWSL